MRKEQLTIYTATRTINKMQECILGVKRQTSNVKRPRTRGFTLVEMIVSLGLFTIIMFIATSAFLSVVNADRKARAVRIAVDNLNIALEDMSRRIKTGYSYYCGSVGETLDTVNDCPAGSNTLFFTNQDGTRMKYALIGPAIFRDTTQVTSPEVTITGLKYLVSGSGTLLSGNKQQPMVVIVVDGSLGSGAASTTFKMQTSITQRVYDN